MSSLLIQGGRVLDPSRDLDAIANVVVEGGRIRYVGPRSERVDRVIDARGLVVCPGLIDMHVHFREPGKEQEETIASGAAAAANGGFTSVAAMPNTEPAVDNEASAEFVTLQARRTGKANVFPIGAVTKGRAGKELSEMGQLFRGGAVAFSDDGAPVANADVMRRALQYARMFDRPIINHCEDPDLVKNGVMNEGFVSMVLGLGGMPAIAEEIMVHRDITLARATGGRVHIAHLSSGGSVELVRQAKARGIRVTAEVTPHHLCLTEEKVRAYDPVYKMNPPLRTAADVEALRQGLRDGTIDAIASDHAPHAAEEKEVEFAAAPFGVIGLETVVPLVVTELVETGVLSLPQAIARLTFGPARILGLTKGTLADGSDADITLLDPGREWTIDVARFQSKSRNCPFHGRRVRGKVVSVLVGGREIPSEL